MEFIYLGRHLYAVQNTIGAVFLYFDKLKLFLLKGTLIFRLKLTFTDFQSPKESYYFTVFKLMPLKTLLYYLMRPVLVLFVFLMTLALHAQGSLSGNFAPPKDFKWLIIYELTPGGEQYIADTAIEDGFFTLKMPATAKPGMYRLVYAVPQDEYYIDIIYNTKENVKFNFDLEEGLTITNSEENKWFNEYFTKIDAAQDKLMEFYEAGGGAGQKYQSLINELKKIQDYYENTKVGTIANKFITSNRSYLPKTYEPLAEFLKHKKQHHFDYLDLDSSILQGSNFLTDKISKYVFATIPAGIKSEEELEEEVNRNVKTLAGIIKDTPQDFQVKAFHQLWEIAEVNTMATAADYIFDYHLKQLAFTTGNQELVDTIETEVRLRIGAMAPEITWNTKGKKMALSTMGTAENYLLIFWSSTCSHCLNELPALHKELTRFENLKVIAVGLEDEELNWKKVASTLPSFNHAIALGKWESEYAHTFNIQKTPTYFILDNKKRFLAKPENDIEVIEFLED